MSNPTVDTSLGLNAKKLVRILSWLGLIPFLALSMVASLGGPDWLAQALLAYGALILAFMAGTYWIGFVVGSRTTEDPRLPLIASNVLVLAAWPVVMIPVAWGSLCLSVLFSVHLLLDAPWRATTGPAWYRHMRLSISLVVISVTAVGGLVGLGLDLGAGLGS